MRNVPLKCQTTLATAAFILSTAAGMPASAQSLRPLETETAVVLPSGATQISLGTSYFRNRRFPHFTKTGVVDSQNLFTAPELEVRIGAGDWVEFQLRYALIYLDETRTETRGTINSEEFGGGDAELFTKIRFVRESEQVPAIGAQFGIKLPNANRRQRLGTDETDFELQILASKDFGPVAAHLNGGIQILGNPGDLDGAENKADNGQDDLFVFSLAAVTAPLLPEQTGSYSIRGLVSIDGKEGSRFNNNGLLVAGGLQVTRSDWTLYSGFSAGLSGAAEDYGFRLGLTYAFELERLRGLFD